jgi:hypothetical protein
MSHNPRTPRPATRLVLDSFTLILLATVAGACGRPPDTAPPVATPTVVLSRGSAAIGAPVEMEYRFVVAPDAAALTEDYWVFVHFLDTDRELMWTDDHQPPTPTQQWKAGQTVEYTRTMFVPKFPYVGRTTVEVGLFSPRTGDRVPLSGDSKGQRSYQVATFDLHLQAENQFVVFRDGWHPTEVADNAAATEWQWSRGTATLSFRNPRQDVVFYLQLDQPVATLPESQHVELRIGESVVDSFDVAPGQADLRKVPIPANQLGTADTVDLRLVVDQTFVPAAIPAMKSTDPRDLGVRVFRAYVETGLK